MYPPALANTLCHHMYAGAKCYCRLHHEVWWRHLCAAGYRIATNHYLQQNLTSLSWQLESIAQASKKWQVGCDLWGTFSASLSRVNIITLFCCSTPAAANSVFLSHHSSSSLQPPASQQCFFLTSFQQQPPAPAQRTQWISLLRTAIASQRCWSCTGGSI